MANKLVNIHVKEVSGVDKAANGKKFLIIKRDDTVPKDIPEDFYVRTQIDKRLLNEILADQEVRDKAYQLIDALWCSIDSIMYDSDKSMEDRIIDLQVTVTQFKDQLAQVSETAADLFKIEKFCKSYKGGEVTMTYEEILKSLSDEDRAVVETKVSKLQGEVVELTKKVDEITPVETIDIDKLDLPESVKKVLKRQEVETKAAQDMAKREREARLDLEFAKKAESYVNISDVTVIAKVLREASEVSEELVKNLESILTAANERIAKGDLFHSVGDEGTAAISAQDEIEKLAKELMKVDPSLTLEKAFTKAMVSNPELYKKYVSGE